MALSVRVAALATLLPTLAMAQRQAYQDSSRYAASLSYGSFEYDLSGTGKSSMWAVRLERPTAKFLLAEGSILWARPYQQFGDTTNFFVGELQVQGQLPLGSFAPYLGVGGGFAYDMRDRQPTNPQLRSATDPTFSASGGVRVWLTRGFGARGELRARSIGGGFSGGSVEWTFGAALRL